MAAAQLVVDCLEYLASSVLVHCSDGWDRTPQLTTLAQLLLDPYYRTYNGFQVLVAKEWFSFGHRFVERAKGAEQSPIVIQLLDCVHQVLAQQPAEFEFTQEYVLFLADAVYSGVYGSFLANSEEEAAEYRYRTQAVWAVHSEGFLNAGYSPSKHNVLRIRTSIKDLRLWEYFTRYHL